MRISIPRTLIGLIAAGCMFALAGCSGGAGDNSTPSPTPASTEPVPSDTDVSPAPTDTTTSLGPMTTLTDLSGITVTGDFDTDPTVTAPYPFNVEKTLCEVLIQGTGTTLDASSVLQVQSTGINASTGVMFDSTFSSGAPYLNQVDGFVPGYTTCLTGQSVGSRVLMAITSDDGYGDAGESDAGINPGDTLLFVVDIESAQFAGPTGDHVADGNQWVTVTDDNGVPTATVNPGQAAPTTLQTTILTQGTGVPVDVNDAVLVNYVTMDYATGQQIENTYSDTTLDNKMALLSNLIPGWRTALTGVPMGSRVLIIVPGSLAYPLGNATPAIAPNATLVCVVDVLYTFTAPSQ